MTGISMTAELIVLMPELMLLTLVSIILVVDTMSQDKDHSLTYILTQISLLLVGLVVFMQFPETAQTVFSGTYIADQMSAVLKIAICIITIVVTFYSFDFLKEHDLIKGEYFVLILFAVLGMFIMVSANSLLTVYLGLELLSLSMYAMVAMNRDSAQATEAAMKYFVLGAIASGMLLYGMSMLYGISGTLELPLIAAYIAQQSDANILLVFGLVFVVIGVAFKLGAVPFHMWLPDVYEGSPTSVTLFISTAPKIAAFAMAIRLLAEGLAPMVADWQEMFMILAVLSMAAGNIIAISQTNIKRMLAYSTIAHVGFLLLGLIAGNQAGYAASMFYVIVYALMSMGSFGMIILLGRKDKEANLLEDFKGLAERSPWFAFIMMMLMFSMAGVPPFVGFWSKWFVIKEVIASGHLWLAATAVVFSVIGAYYYLRIIKLMYFDKPDQMTAIKASQEMRMVLSINGLSLLIIGLAPGLLMALCINAFI
jgi:NADH-quinone oxidoreductase subunit N